MYIPRAADHENLPRLQSAVETKSCSEALKDLTLSQTTGDTGIQWSSTLMRVSSRLADTLGVALLVMCAYYSDNTYFSTRGVLDGGNQSKILYWNTSYLHDKKKETAKENCVLLVRQHKGAQCASEVDEVDG